MNNNEIGQLNYRSDKDRLFFDSYFTPPYATNKLLEVVKFDGDILEPASGDGHISKILESSGYNVISSDLRPDCYGTSGLDFLSMKDKVDNIVTNPPYCLAEEFMGHGLQLINNKMALLFRLSFLESAKRYPLFTNSPLSNVFVLSKRLPHWDGKEFKGSATFAHAWFVWDKHHDGPPTIGWLL